MLQMEYPNDFPIQTFISSFANWGFPTDDTRFCSWRNETTEVPRSRPSGCIRRFGGETSPTRIYIYNDYINRDDYDYNSVIIIINYRDNSLSLYIIGYDKL